MKKYIFVFVILQSLFISFLYSQQIGEWKTYLSYQFATKTIPINNKIYVLSNGALYSYDTEDSSVETYDNINLLNDVEIAYMAYSKAYKTLLLIYKNSNIDLLINEKETYNIPDFMNKSMTEDKTVNHVVIKDEYAYLSTNFGIVILNIKKKEITNSYILDKKVNACAIIDKTIYAATEKGIYTGLLTDNLLDSQYWKLLSSSVFDSFFYYDNTLVGNNSTGLFKIDAQSGESQKITDQNYTFIDNFDTKLIAGNLNSITLFENINSYKIINVKNDFYHLSYSKNNDTYWGSNGGKGLNGYKYEKENNQLINIIQNILPDSPKRNFFEYMTFTNNRLLVAGGGIVFDRSNYPGTVLMYENGEWSSFQEEGIEEKTGLAYKDATSIVEDPAKPNHFFVSSAGEGVYEFQDKKFIQLYNETNSSLVSIFPDKDSHPHYLRINGLQYDNKNNLWVLNSGVKNIINIFNGKKWFSLYYPEIEKKVLTRGTMFDSRGWAWILISYKSPGLFCLNTNNTLENTKDDQTAYFNSFTNQDGESIKDVDVLSIAEDKKGAIWIGTNKGPLILNNPSKIFEEGIYFTQIKIPRNDGTNNADFLLASESINAICIDGANRKWIGSSGSGVYLLSEDGLETIHHFTIENSPLLSNHILSMAIDPSTGEIFIGTDKGLISYKSDAIESENSFSEEAHAYPNPVPSDYNGVIAVTGLISDSDVKITDVNGNLIYTGSSVGGQFTWNGKNKSGKRVASGVYFVLAANAEGKEGIVTKILMIK